MFKYRKRSLNMRRNRNINNIQTNRRREKVSNEQLHLRQFSIFQIYPKIRNLDGTIQ